MVQHLGLVQGTETTTTTATATLQVEEGVDQTRPAVSLREQGPKYMQMSNEQRREERSKKEKRKNCWQIRATGTKVAARLSDHYEPRRRRQRRQEGNEQASTCRKYYRKKTAGHTWPFQETPSAWYISAPCAPIMSACHMPYLRAARCWPRLNRIPSTHSPLCASKVFKTPSAVVSKMVTLLAQRTASLVPQQSR
ncbi:hypothetical protein M404DRAFT_252808 [Pisolithus tinctorius Marx 270]|uniref:Uncharacterized protein n=1 Tax=Pisolithus tinctorius Marx 270 TaxID=870435 RepID=A0A0C3NLJ4_PISTI|nr:hypothetical protein M404DRAFT_252808 [Pisolithus tinctorius Marx 270]